MRIRITFPKTEAIRFIGHLDVFKAWERTFRRAKLPIAYTHGFRPKPRINLASALPLGITSEHELLDVWLDMPIDLEFAYKKLETALPPGIRLYSIEEINPQAPALQTQVISAEYIAILLIPIADIDSRINYLLASKNILRKRGGKIYDLRPLIEDLFILPIETITPPQLFMRLMAKEKATGRPDEVIDALGISITDVRIHRKRIILKESTTALAKQSVIYDKI